MLENFSSELDKTESRLDMVSKKVGQVLQLSDGSIYNFKYLIMMNIKINLHISYTFKNFKML